MYVVYQWILEVAAVIKEYNPKKLARAYYVFFLKYTTAWAMPSKYDVSILKKGVSSNHLIIKRIIMYFSIYYSGFKSEIIEFID